MKVSVLMPTYNRAILVNGITLVERAILSCLEQTHKDFELLILNDGSTDNTSEILKNYADHPQIKIFDESINRMPPNNMNFLWTHADGDLVCQLHDDDEMPTNSLELRVAEFEKDPFLDVLYGGWITQDLSGNNRREYPGTPPDPERIMKSEYINFTTLMYQRRLQFQFDGELRYYFDWLFKIRCLNECIAGYVAEPVMIHTVHEGQETSKCRRENMNAIEEKKMREKLKTIYNR